MKKILFLTYAALALFALSCTKEEDLPTPSPTEGKTFVSVGGSRELPATGTKSQMADDGVFSWTYSSNENEYNDEILICGYYNEKYTFTGIKCIGYPDENEKKNARFEGWVTGSIQDYAVFPATLGASLSGSTLTLTLPSEIDWKKGEADNLMVAPTRTYANGVHNFAFYNVAGLFKVTLNGLPSTARKVSFYAAKSFAETSPKKITGAFSIDMSAVDLSGETKVYPQIVTTTVTSDDCLTIKWTDEPEESMVFYVPVPTGEYTGFSFRVKDAEDNVLASFKGKTAKSVTRGKLIILPALTLTTAGGGGDNGGSKLVVPHNYTANNGVFVLPETSSDIELDIESNNEVTIAYSSENAEKKPANVYMTVLGDVNSLTINLPESHVELGGQTVNNNNYTITNLKANTSISTLLVKKTVKIGKSDVENSGLTVTGGSLDLAASVAGTVKVIYDPAEETVNKTNEKVSIKINSEIKDLVVKSASTQSAPDKIYVTIEEDAVVNSAITVPEVNCNLYIAPKAQATTVTTSAAENTVAGTVENLTAQPKEGEETETIVTVTVTEGATVTNVSATGAQTSVDILEGSEVTSVNASNSATVSIANGVDQVGESEEAPITNDNSSNQNVDNGHINVGVVATIGSAPYTSLADAVAAVTSGQTIALLCDVTYDDGILYNKEGVSAKLNLNGKTLTVNTGSNANNRAIRIDNGTLEVYGGSIVAVGSGTNSSNGAGCYGAFRVEGNGVLNAHDLTLTNSRPWGLNVKVVGGVATLTNVTINSSYGGGIEVTEADLGTSSKTGSATLTNCTFTQTGYFDHCSTTLSVSGGSALTINSGSYTSENYAMYVFSSGGIITVNGGTFQATGSKDAIKAEIDLNTYPTYTGGLLINGGTVTGGFAITSPAYMSITGGTYDHDPSAYVADGYQAVKSGNLWTVSKVAGVAAIGSQGYSTLAAAFEAAQNGNTITVLSDIDVPETIAVAKNVTLDLNGNTLYNTTDLWNKANGTWSVFSVREGGNLTVTGNGTIDAKENDCYTFDVRDGGVLTIKNGTYTGNISCVYLINKEDTGVSTCNIEGGTFSLKQLQSGGDGYRFLLNCLDEDYTNNYVRFNVTGGSFVNFNPANNLAEGAGTNFVADGYAAFERAAGSWTVEQLSASNSAAKIGNTYYVTIAQAVAAANESGNVTIKLLRDYDFEANEPGYGYTTSFLAEGESSARENMLVVSGNSITFDLDGHTISNLFNNTFSVTGNNVVFQNGEMRVGQLYYSDLNGTTVYTSENDRTCSYIVYVKNATNFTVNNLTTYGGINVSGSTATINDLSFSGTKFYAVCSQSNSAVTLNGGTYTKAITGATGNLFWIEDGSTMNITGGTYTKGNASFRADANPVITGGTFDFNPSNFGVANGYAAVDNGDGTWTVSEVNYVAQIESAKYETLEEAFAAVPAGTPTTITMIANANLGSEQITIGSDKKITLELNGKTVSKNAAKNDSDALFCNRGTLTIQDNTDTQKDGTGTGKISYLNGLPDPKDWPGYATNTITNNGALTIKSGYVENITEGGYAAYTVDNQTNGTLYTPVFNMEGGKLYNKGTDAVRMFLNSTSNLNQVNVSGGIIDGSKDGRIVCIQDSNGNASKGEFNMTGGVVTKDVSGWSAANNEYTYTDAQYEQVRINISGGQMRAFLTTYMPATAARAEALRVTGGTFSTDPSDYVSAGYEAYQDGEVWKIREATGPQYWINYAAASYESVDETNKVITIANAAQLAKLAKDVRRNESTNYQQVSNFEGYTIRLVADIDLSGKIWFPIGADNTWSPEEQAAKNADPCYNSWFRGTFDGNGKTIRNMHAVHEENAGLFGCAVYATFTNIKVEDFKIESNHFAGGVIAWIEVGAKAPSITNCTVKNGTITSSPILIGNAYDNGDKVGGICGFLYTGANRPVAFSGNTVEDVNITAYRDFGGLLGYGNYATVSGNTVKDVKLYQNNTNAYKSGTITTFGPEIGRNADNTSTASNNIITNVKMYTGVPGEYTEVP